MSKQHVVRRSLAMRYALVTSVLILCILTAILWAYLRYDQEKISASYSIESAQTIERSNGILRGLLLRGEQTRSSFLISPLPDLQNNTIAFNEQALSHVRNTLSSDELDLSTSARLIYQDIEKHIQRLIQKTRLLIEVRLDREQLFPAMSFIVDGMYPANLKFYTSLDLLINELDPVTHVEEKFVLKDLQRIWGTMISEFRVFMAFRTGTFGRPEVGMPVYSKNVVLLHNEITKKLDVVKSLIDDEQVGFTAESSYEVMTDASREWREIFDRVRTIQSSDKWRMDTVIIEDEIRPISRAIQQQLSELDAYAAQTYQTALGDFDRATTLIGRIIIFIPLLVIAFMVTGFLYFRRQVIKPIAQMSHTMRDETVGDRAFTGHESDASEISDLFLAFNTMNKRIEERETHLKYLVLHDRMTGLPNREFMRKKMGELLEQPDASFAFLLIGVDRFKEVNDCYGYKVGDQVLSHISNILQSEYQQVAFIARIGSDEYGLLMINGNETSARKLAANIHAQLALPIKTNSHLVSISVSIGISIYPEHGHSVDSIMSRAVIALQHAKQDHSIVNVYTTDRDLNSETRLKVIDELRYAIEHDKLEVEYQPQVSLKDGKVIGFEVLSRLPTMKHHNMTTQELIELAEQTGLIHQLTEWVLQSVFKHCSAWPEGNKQLSVGVNLSMASFHNPSLIDTIKAGMSSWKLPGNNLKLEITESLMMGDPQQAKRLLNEFHNMGVKISIDDFGTGYSSLNYLTDLMVHELKIDRSFIASMESSDKHRAIVKTIINIADNLGVEVVAEGVETREQYEMVRALGCYAAQGYYISTSIPEDEVEGWLDSGKWQAVS